MERRKRSNAFDPAFLRSIEKLDEPATAAEADVAGPWKVLEIEGGYGVFLDWESPESGDEARAVFEDRDLAERLAAVMPAVGPMKSWRLAQEAGPRGFALFGNEEQPLGYLRHSNPEILGALWIADHLARSPRALATLLGTIGFQALQHVGKLVARGLQERMR